MEATPFNVMVPALRGVKGQEAVIRDIWNNIAAPVRQLRSVGGAPSVNPVSHTRIVPTHGRLGTGWRGARQGTAKIGPDRSSGQPNGAAHYLVIARLGCNAQLVACADAQAVGGDCGDGMAADGRALPIEGIPVAACAGASEGVCRPAAQENTAIIKRHVGDGAQCGSDNGYQGHPVLVNAGTDGKTIVVRKGNAGRCQNCCVDRVCRAVGGSAEVGRGSVEGVGAYGKIGGVTYRASCVGSNLNPVNAERHRRDALACLVDSGGRDGGVAPECGQAG